MAINNVHYVPSMFSLRMPKPTLICNKKQRNNQFRLNFTDHRLFILIYCFLLLFEAAQCQKTRETPPPTKSLNILTSPLLNHSTPATRIRPLKKTNALDCNGLFEKCLCSFNEQTRRHFLYCNDHTIRKMPDFKDIYAKLVAAKHHTQLSLVFSKLDFSGSSIRRIRKEDLAHLQLDLLPSNLVSNHSTLNSSTADFESLLEQLKQSFVPIYHLDFDNILEIDDGSFLSFMANSLALTYELAAAAQQQNPAEESLLTPPQNENLLLKLRFSNSKFDFAPTRKPFMGLKALELHLNNISNEYLANSIFDQSVISEIYLENSPHFVGFVDASSTLPNGRLLHRFVVTRSYKIEQLCSHSLPSFVDQETFHDITIKKCGALRQIKPFAFYKYPHLRTLVLAGNNLSRIDKDSFRYLSQLELLDLSSNPIAIIEPDAFRDLASLRTLLAEATQLKRIEARTFVGLLSLGELRLSKSAQLSRIDARSFRDSRGSLRELHLKDTQVRLVDSLDEDGVEPPYLPHQVAAHKFNEIWLDGLNLTLLNLESSSNADQFGAAAAMNESAPRRMMCKMARHVPAHTLVNLQRHQACTCMVYLLYRRKEFPLFPRWEFKTPFCYRNQIQIDENGTKSFKALRTRETDCGLDTLDAYCSPLPTTTTTTTTTTSTTSTTTTTSTIPTTTQPPITPQATRRRWTSRSNRPLDSTSRKKPSPSFPKLDVKKFFKVMATGAGVSVLSVLLTCVALRVTSMINERKKEAKSGGGAAAASRLRKSSQSSSQATSTSKQAVARKSLVLPPSVIPPIKSVNNGGGASGGVDGEKTTLLPQISQDVNK